MSSADAPLKCFRTTTMLTRIFSALKVYKSERLQRRSKVLRDFKRKLRSSEGKNKKKKLGTVLLMSRANAPLKCLRTTTTLITIFSVLSTYKGEQMQSKRKSLKDFY